MKKLVWLVAIAILLALANMASGCSRVNGGAKIDAKADTLKADTVSMVEVPDDYVGEYDMLEMVMEMDTAPNILVGNFSGNGVDTLECVPYGPKIVNGRGDTVQTSWEIRSRRGTCKSMTMDYVYEPKLLYEGDLDGDGANEFGSYIVVSAISTNQSYQVFTYKGGEWKWLYDPLALWYLHYYELRENGTDIVSLSHKKGYVTVRYTYYGEIGINRIKTQRVKVKPAAIIQ